MHDLLQAASLVFNAESLIVLVLGTASGIVIGALPGLTVNMGIALLLPLTFTFQGMTGILMLLGVYCGAIYGGSISAILINTPGTPASAATVLDGYPMALKGEAGRALGLSTASSMFGGLFSAVTLVIVAPLLAKVATGLSAPDYFALGVFGISIITSVSSASIIKGLIGGTIGLFIAVVGLDPMTAGMRFTFDSYYLMGGISFVPVLVGLFAFSQALLGIEENWNERAAGITRAVKVKITRVLPTWPDFRLALPTYLRSSAIGTVIGSIPGTGGDIASFVAYTEAKRWSKHPETFGKGSVEGVSAPEAGANAVAGGAMVPLLTLGIPGDGATAIMMGAFMVQGLSLGPLLFTEHAADVNTIFIGLFVANLLMGLIGFSSIRLFTRVMAVPRQVLVPIILVLSTVGAYSVNNTMTDVFVMMAAGVLAYVLIKLDFSMSPVIIGIILGPMAETNFRRALVMSDGEFSIFWTSPVCATFLVIAVLTLLLPIFGPKISAWRKARRGDTNSDAPDNRGSETGEA